MASFLELSIERPVAGGRMLARHDGQVVFVHGALPGERVRARIERRQKQLLFADTVEVLEASPDRRAPVCDLACGGSSYAHIHYDRQRLLKGEIIADAFARIAKQPLAGPVTVAASPEAAYRMRARVHVEGGRWGFYREGTHTLCDAAATQQLRPDTCAAIDAFVAAQPALMPRLTAITVSENVDATARILQLEPKEGAGRLKPIADLAVPGIHGVSAHEGPTLWGAQWIEDSSAAIWPAGAPFEREMIWRRRPASFFQGNRFLLGALVNEVLRAAGDAARVIDLYAGGGLFSVALAATERHVIAIEMDGSSARDLADNAQPLGERLVALASPVEPIVRQRPPFVPGAVVMDPPRAGASPEALAGVTNWSVPKVIYVSCDPPTLARDCGKLIASGYRLTSITGFDLFPNTPHVEAVAVLER
ncbi:MAG: class I SAM-dependent RNA methyltransferase [Acidobacteria bacterium]|nr:class I SAM-dependent RNA methyltransferase [Acidobacteriota bacterium]